MLWTISPDPDEFDAAAGPFLRGQPALHTILLSALASLRANPPGPSSPAPLLGWWTRPDGRVGGACLRTPPHPMSLTSLPAEAAVALAGTLVDRALAVGSVHGVTTTARTFAEAWKRLTGGTVSLHMTQRLYRLAMLEPPSPPPPGEARPARAADRDLLIRWYEEFGREVGEPTGDAPRLVDSRLDHGGLVLWEVGRVPVALAGMTRVAGGMARIAPVYVPPRHRRRGYAAAATADVTRRAQAAGAAEVVLFTDLANPTSNALYQRLGFRPVTDFSVLTLAGGPRCRATDRR